MPKKILISNNYSKSGLDNEALQKRIGSLEDDVEEKTNQLFTLQAQSEEATKEFADTEQQLRTEYKVYNIRNKCMKVYIFRFQLQPTSSTREEY